MKKKHIPVAVVLAVIVSAAGMGAITAFGDGERTVAAQNASDPVVETDEPDRQIHVSATGEVQGDPDQAVVRVAVVAEADTVGAVRNQLANGSATLTTALEQLGVEYETTRYDISEQRFRGEDQQPEFDYEGTHAYQITADDAGLAGEVVDTAVDAGAVVENVVLTISEERREQLRETAIRNAIQDADNQSEIIADASGLNVVAPVSIDASERRFVPVSFESVDADDGDGPPTEIAPGLVSVSYEVDVSYEVVRD